MVEKMESQRKKEVYAAQGVNVGTTSYIIGGMAVDGNGHHHLRTVKKLGYNSWPRDGNLKASRAFFCAVNLLEQGFLAIGGLSEIHGENVVTTL